ncbi:MAG: UDP-N-acetylglucosamine transferase subunit ALG14 [Candidatus Methanomethyliaceae archaeon]|nr:UDP-N-acetylglucosamine transferase subunit ALG14 [Candidatus Methanomethyliaceae archaeon]
MKILAVLGSGGHTAQIIKLIELLGDQFDYQYMVGFGDVLSVSRIRRKGKVYFVHRARDHGDDLLTTAFKVMRLFFESLFVIISAKPDAVISAGPGLAVPISILGKIFGKKVIFLESWSRVYRGSTAGRILYHFADLFFVQWSELKRVYPRAIYAGRLL